MNEQEYPNVIPPNQYREYNDQPVKAARRAEGRERHVESRFPCMDPAITGFHFTNATNRDEHVQKLIDHIGDDPENCLHQSFGSLFMRAFGGPGASKWRRKAQEVCERHGLKMMIHYKTQCFLIFREDDWYSPKEDGEYGRKPSARSIGSESSKGIKQKKSQEKKPMRNRSGTNNVNAKLTDEDVREIRAMYKAGTKRQEIADQFGIAVNHVGDIGKRRIWRHVED